MEEAEDETEDPDPEEAELQPLVTLEVNQDQTGDRVITPHHHLPAVTTTIGGGRTRGSAWSRQAAHGKTNALPDQRIEDLTSSARRSPTTTILNFSTIQCMQTIQLTKSGLIKYIQT